MNAQTVDLTYGSKLSGSTLSIFANEAKVGFDSGNQGLIAFGYFADGFDVAAEAAALNDTNFSTFVGNFNVLAETSFNAATEGFLSNQTASFGEEGKDKTGYILTLAGVTAFSSASSATEIGLFHDTTDIAAIPGGGDPIATDYAIDILTYDTVVLGTGHDPEAFTSGTFNGFTGNVYSTQAIGANVPEPSTYAMMLGALSFGFVFYKRRIAGKKTEQKQKA